MKAKSNTTAYLVHRKGKQQMNREYRFIGENDLPLTEVSFFYKGKSVTFINKDNVESELKKQREENIKSNKELFDAIKCDYGDIHDADCLYEGDMHSNPLSNAVISELIKWYNSIKRKGQCDHCHHR